LAFAGATFFKIPQILKLHNLKIMPYGTNGVSKLKAYEQ
jgi:hypothetical protein